MKLLCIILYYSIETIFDFDQELWFSGDFVRHICKLLERKLRVGSEFSANKDVGSDSYQPTWPKSEVLTGNGSVHTSEINAKIQEETQHETFTSGAVLDWLCSVCKVSFFYIIDVRYKVWFKFITLKQRICIVTIMAPHYQSFSRFL